MIDALISLIQDIISPLQWSLNWINILEIAFIAAILLIFYQKFIKNTQSEKLVKGLFFLVFAWIFSEILILIDLRILGVFLKSLVTLISLSLIVIFQPELRRLLGYLGQPGFIRKALFSSNSNAVIKNNLVAVYRLQNLLEMIKQYQQELDTSIDDIKTNQLISDQIQINRSIKDNFSDFVDDINSIFHTTLNF